MNDPLRILILEDNAADAELIQFELHEADLNFTSKLVTTKEAYEQALLDYYPDLILSDYDLPSYNGALALAEAKRQRPDTPFILVTGAVTEDRAIEIFTKGAKDYVLKNRLQQRLAPAVRRAVAEAQEHKARQKAVEDLHEVSLYSRSLIEASLDPLVTISSQGKVMDVNKATEQITGVSREQIIGNDFSVFFTDREKARLGYEKAFSEGSITDYPLAIRHATGRVTEVLYNASTYLDKEGRVQGVFAAARDVTKLKMAEEELRRTHKHLENEVAEKTKELRKEIEQRNRAEQSLINYNKRIELLAYTASRLLASNNPQQIVEEICLKVMEFLDCDAFFNFLADEASGRLHLNACAGIPEEAAREIEWLDYGVAICGCAAQEARRIIAENIPTTPDVRTDLVKSYGIKAYACHPLMQENRILGTLSFGTRLRTTFSTDDLSIMKAVADHVAIAMARIRTENSLRESEQKYRRLIQHAPSGIYDIDFSTGRFTDVNDAMCQTLGYTREELLALTAFNILDDEGKALFASRIRCAQSGKKPDETVEYRVRTKDGGTIWSILNTEFHRDGDRITGATVVAHNITERKLAEEALQRLNANLQESVVAQTADIRQAYDLIKSERQRLYDVLEILPSYVALLTPDYHIPFANRFFRERFGEVRGEKCYEHLFGQTEPCDICETYKVLQTQKPHHWEWLGPDGCNYDVHDFPFTDSDGSFAILEMGIDITEIKRAEAALKEANEMLEKRVADCTAQLEAVNKELESFSYSVSHDLRTPLRAIEGYSRMILRQEGENFDEKTKSLFDTIIDNTKMMGQLIEDLLALSRMGREAISLSTLNMDKLINDVWDELAANGLERKIDLKISHVPPVMGDRLLIKQVLVNLLSNAVKFSRVRNIPLIEVGGYQTKTNNVYYIRDNGVGFDMQYYKKLFGVFQRLHSADDFEGTGVGLAIVYRIINRHGGKIWAEGDVDKGATFYFTLPTHQQGSFAVS